MLRGLPPMDAAPTPFPTLLSSARATFTALVRWLLPRARWPYAVALGTFLVTNLSVGVWRTAHDASDLIYGYLLPTRGMLFEGKDPFTDYGFNSFTPFFYVVMAPLAYLPDAVASVTWNVLSLGLFAVTLGLVRELMIRTARPQTLAFPAWAPLLAVMLVYDNVQLSQSNMFTLFFVVAAVYALVQEQDFKAGALLSVAISFKVTPALFGLYLLLRGRWKAFLGLAAGGLACVGVLPALLFGVPRALLFAQEWAALVVLPFLTGEKVRTNNVSFFHTNQSLEAFLVRHFTPYATERYGGLHAVVDPAFLTEAQASRVALVLKLVLVGLLVALGLRARKLGTRPMLMETALFLLAALFLSPVSWFNHYISAAVAYAVVVQEAVMLHPGARRRRWLLGTLGVACFLTTVCATRELRSYSPVFLAHAFLFGALYVQAWKVTAKPDGSASR